MTQQLSTTTIPVSATIVTIPVTPVAPVTTDATTVATGNIFSRVISYLFRSDAPVSTAATSTSTTTADTSTAPVITTAAATSTEADPVDEALSKLLERATVNKLWKETVEDGSTFLAVITLGVSSLINRVIYCICLYIIKSADLEADQTTAINYEIASANHVAALAVRYLNAQESSIPVTRNDKQAREFIALQTAAETTTLECDTALKARVKYLGFNENSQEFAAFSAASQKRIKAIGALVIENFEKGKGVVTPFFNKKIDLETARMMAAEMSIKLETTKQASYLRAFNDIIKAFAEQSLESITIESLKQKIALIKESFQTFDTVDIERNMRQAIKAHHGTAIANLQGEFENAAVNAPRTVQIIEALSVGLIAERTVLEAELRVMRGNSYHGTNGTYNAAYEAVHGTPARDGSEAVLGLEAECAAARTAYYVAAGQLVPPNSGTNAELAAALRRARATTSNTNPVGAAEQLFITKTEDLIAAESALAAIKSSFDQIAVYTGSTITGGRLYQINQEINNLSVPARALAAKTAGFYEELNKDVDESNKVARSTALNAIFA